MDTEEEEKNSNPPNPSTEIPNESVTIENAITATDTNDTQPELASTNTQCEPEPEPLALSPSSETETMVPNNIKDQVMAAEALEVGGGEGVSQPAPVIEAGESVPEVGGGEGEGDGGLIGGAETGGVTNDLAVKEEIEYGTSDVENETEEAIAAEIVEEVNNEKLSDEIETGVGVEAVAEVNDKVDESLMEEKAVVVDKIEEEEENNDMAEAGVTTKELEEEKVKKMETDDMDEVEEDREEAVSKVAEVGDTEMAVVAEEKDKEKEEEMGLDDVVEEAENEIGVEEAEMVKEADDTSEPEETEMAKEVDDTSEPEEMEMAKEADDTSEPEETEMAKEVDDTSEPEETEMAKEVADTSEPEETEMAKEADDTSEPEKEADDTSEPEETEMAKEVDDTSEPEETEMAKEVDDTSEPEETEMAKEVDDTSEPEETEMAKEVDYTSETEETEMANEPEETEMADEAEETNEAEETEMADEAEDTNEVEETETAEETEGADEEVTKSAGEKRKRGKNAKASTKVSSRKKAEEDVCFICFDGGELVLCDRRGCPKAYHPSCVNRDKAFFRTKGRWNCGWHLCSNCEKNACYMCYTCTFSLCKGCIKDAAILCVRGNKGFCETCMKTVLLIEKEKTGNKEMAQVDFDDKSSWMYLFKDYWTDLKVRLSLTSEELATAKNSWKGSDLHGGKQESPDEVYDVHNDGGSGSDSYLNAEATPSKRRKAKKRFKSRAKERDSSRRAMTNGKKGVFADESVDWASKELLEFVLHMKDGDKCVCSQFDVQALLLEYIKRNKLRDPHRKSQIVCDSRLENLFGKPRVGHFEMLKLLESHFLVKDDSQADVLQESNVDTESNPLEADENSEGFAKSSKDKKRKSRKKGDRRGLQSNLDDFAAIDMHNISLIYLRRSLVEDLIEDTESFGDKVIGSFVRIRISGSAQKQDLYRLVQVTGTKQAAEPYKVGKKVADLLLEILNLNKIEVISMDIISNQDFTEDECKRLRQSIKCGLINRLTVGDIQEKAMALQSVRVKDILETEITRISHLRDRASDMGKRKELRECVEKLQLLKSPEERQGRLEEIPEIHADPKMDPSYESEEENDETDEKRQENYLRPRGSSFSRRGREPVSPHKGSSASNDSWGGARNHSGMNRELNRNMSNKGLLNKGEDAVGASEMVNENFWSQGREKEAQQSQVWDKMKTASKSEIHSALPVVDITPLESGPRAALEVLPRVTQSAANVNEAEKIWHYRDPAGKTQGPFSILQLRKWNKSGYFPTDLRVWRTTEKEDDSILLAEAMNGNFQKDPPSVSTFLMTQPIQAPPAPIEVPKHSTTVSTDRWASETNLPSPTPGHTASGGRMKNAYESKWPPTPSTNSASILAANPFSGGGGLQRAAGAIPESGQLSSKLGGRVDGTNMSHVANPMSKPEGGMLLSSANAQLHPQTLVPSETLRAQQRPSHPLPVQDNSGASVNAAIDIKSLQNLVQPMSNNNTLVGSHGWGGNSVARSDVNISQSLHAVGSQAWGSIPSQKLETNNLVSMPSQNNVYGNWGNPTASAHTSASFGAGNPTGVSPVPGSAVLVPSDRWRTQQNIPPSTPSNAPWGMAVTDNQSTTTRQVQENQNAGWQPVPGNPNLGWVGPVPANSNQGWIAPGQGPVPGNVNPGWVGGQGQAPGKNNQGWAGPVQGQAPGNAYQNWAPAGQGPAPLNASQAWAPSGNANPSWQQQPGGNVGGRGSEMNQNGDRYSSQRDRGSHSGDSGGKPWNRQSSFSRGGDSSRPLFNKGQRVCKYHEGGHCKKGASCDYMHT